MAFGSSLLAVLVLTLSVAAKPIEIRDNFVSLPLTKHLNLTGTGNLLARDQARVKALKNRSANVQSASADASNVPVTNQASYYSVQVGVGSSTNDYTLIVDTGSSNTWVGADKPYDPSSDPTGVVSVTYGSGFFIGLEYDATLYLGSLIITDQSIGDADYAEGFDGVDGILGLGPVDLTSDTVLGTSTVPTVTDNLYSQNSISEDLVAISFEPTTTESSTNGELTFGGTDSSKYTGSINYVPITTTSPASEYWGIDQSVTYGSSGTPILSETAGIVDTGTTLILLASDAYSAYQSATGATADETTGLLRITESQYSDLESLYFNIGGVTYELTANAQIWPRSLNSVIGGSSDYVYLVVGSTGEASGSGLDFIDGYAFLERFYSVFDTGNSRVGLATTQYTDATTN
ncbi:aspartic peptidase A1 [Wolfiporia cocos MD-104 SS10]|uniref:Aspartic peptidase A1 n=1 Tax=Wolfiporia cocos (strain MD-104) TaxID=742152 RepID=A0A2H3J5X2_WOLCO|nr:aspartic peptidase A1 [Wolfiporia cocos MD-104 SS10]